MKENSELKKSLDLANKNLVFAHQSLNNLESEFRNTLKKKEAKFERLLQEKCVEFQKILDIKYGIVNEDLSQQKKELGGNLMDNEAQNTGQLTLQQNFIIPKSYEVPDSNRLKRIGCAYLNLAVSKYLYVEHKSYNEGQLTVARSNILSKDNLSKTVKNKDLALFMQTLKLPPCYDSIIKQYIRSTDNLNCIKVITGAYLISLGPTYALKLVDWLGIKVILENKIPNNDSKNKLINLYNKNDFKSIEKKIEYEFNDKSLLVQAFTHSSYCNEKDRITNGYKRLEFLGDAILDYIVTRFLFERKNCFNYGILADLRIKFLTNNTFASLSVKYNFHKHLLYSCDFNQQIDSFVAKCKKNNKSLFINEDAKVPKVLADIFEALIGSIFLDSRMDLDVVYRVYYNSMKDVFDECCPELVPYLPNPKMFPLTLLTESKEMPVLLPFSTLKSPAVNLFFKSEKPANSTVQDLKPLETEKFVSSSVSTAVNELKQMGNVLSFQKQEEQSEENVENDLKMQKFLAINFTVIVVFIIVSLVWDFLGLFF